jgi:prophage antirepressor-like protein
MTRKNGIKIFDEKLVRTVWDDEQEKWYFSVIDVVQALTDQPDFQRARNYWKVLKNRLLKEGNETVTNCNRLKLLAEDGKMRETDVADSEQLFRLIQSIPSPKAEPFKLWLAQIASERLDELQDPELTIDRAMFQYKKLGYSDNWINQRLKSIEIRKELTDEWRLRSMK